MSKLKERVAKKLKSQLGWDVESSDIMFYKNGNRGDVVRWGYGNYVCFTSASHSVKKHVELTVSDFDDCGIEIHASPPC